MNEFRQDFRFALRQLRKSPGFTAIAVVTLALGIGLNATMFSLISGFLLQRPPGTDPQRIAVISSVNPDPVFHADGWAVSVPNFLAWKRSNTVFSDMAAADDYRSVSLGAAGSRQPEAIRSAAVSSNYFEVFGASPQIGRSFAEGEDQAGRDHVVILSHDLWERRFGSDPRILGRTLRLNREDWVVIGVMPKNFRMMGYVPQLWTPLTLTAADQSPDARKARSLHILARLKPGVTIEQANAEMAALAQHAQNEFPMTEKGWGARVRSLHDFLIYDFSIGTGLLLIMTAVGFVLMIACANVAGLLLARATGRQKELSIRVSLGARRFDIVRQLLTEGLAIALLGGALGLVISNWGIALVRANLSFNEVIRAVPLRLDQNVLWFALGISLASAVLCSLVPALKASRSDINAVLNDESRGSTSGRSQGRMRQFLVTGEIAMALFLLVGAGLLLRGIFLLEHQNLGFATDHLLTAGLSLDNARYKDAPAQVAFVRNLLSQLRQFSGVESVAAASDLPATGSGSVTLRIGGQPELPANQRPSAIDVVVTSDYFRTAGIPLLHGRTFTETDDRDAPRVVVVSQEFVRRHLAGQDALGKQIQLDLAGGKTDWSQIVGVVGDVKAYSEEPRIDPEVYEPYLQRPVSDFSLMIRTRGDPASLAGALRTTVGELDSDLPLADVITMSALIERQRYGNPFFTKLLGCLGILALVLAAIGLYGLVAYSVGRRTHEIGIRMALGARTADVLGMILGEGLRMAAIGGGIGLVLALPLPKLFDALFFGFHFREPRLFVGVPLAILLVALLATYLPARRAGKVDPMVALHYE
jgi:predicted permease